MKSQATAITKLFFSGLVLVLPAVGCQRAGSLPEVDYGRLPGVQGSADQKLRDEFARVVEQQGTPVQLDGPIIDDAENVAAGLIGAFATPGGPCSADRLRAIREFADELFPEGEFSFNRVQLSAVARFIGRHESQRLAAREALERPRCDFGVRHQDGFALDRRFIDVARICGRFEAFHAARRLFAEDDLDGAIESVRFQLRLAECLGAEKLLDARLEAAAIRAEALGVVQAIVNHEHLRPAQIAALRALIADHLKTWPSDADAWIGDRALGMIAYEYVRDGAIALLLTPDEIERFAAEGILRDLPGATQRSVDQDELYYLETMRTVIDRCTEPYHARADLAETIRNDLHKRRNSPDFPFVAGRMLLENLDAALAQQAEDRARVEAWALALDLAAGERSPHQLNPMTGRNYQVQREPEQILLWLDAEAPRISPADIVVRIPKP